MPCQSKGPREGDVDFMKVKTSQNLSTGCSKRKAVYDSCREVLLHSGAEF